MDPVFMVVVNQNRYKLLENRIPNRCYLLFPENLNRTPQDFLKVGKGWIEKTFLNYTYR